MNACVVKPKERSIHFPEHEKILQTMLESYVNRVSIMAALFIISVNNCCRRQKRSFLVE